MQGQRKDFKDEMQQQRQEFKDEMQLQRQKFREGLVALRININEGFDQLNRKIDQNEGYLKSIGGTNLELHSRDYFKAILDAKGIKVRELQWQVNFEDKKQRLGTPDIELDLLSENPFIAVEITNYINTLDKISKFIRKLEFLEEKYSEKPLPVIIAYEVSESIRKEADNLIVDNGIKLITLGRNDFFD